MLSPLVGVNDSLHRIVIEMTKLSYEKEESRYCEILAFRSLSSIANMKNGAS